MGYNIEYKRLFVKSNEGITPCWLVGPNNVTKPHTSTSGRRRCYERRCRDWSVFLNQVGTTQQALLDEASIMKGSYGEHWKRNGKWVTDDGLDRWIKSGCKRASTVEEILDCNPGVIHSIRCYLSVWRKETYGENCELLTYVTDSIAFDAWIQEAKQRMAAKEENETIFPIVDFQTEEFLDPAIVRAAPNGKVLLKDGKSFVYDLRDRGYTCGPDARQALLIDTAELPGILKKHQPWPFVHPAHIAYPPASEQSGLVIRFKDGLHAGKYIVRNTGRHVQLSDDHACAFHYASLEGAVRAMTHLQSKLQVPGTLEVAFL